MIVGITAEAGAGKDTMAGFLVKHGFHRVAFADPFKVFCKEVFGWSDEQLWGPSALRNEPDPAWQRPDGTCLSPREALQTLGSEWGRRCHPDVWVRYAIRQARRLGRVVISDVRFDNEAQVIREAGGVVVKLVRDGVAPLAAGLPGHVSEAGVSPLLIDWVIVADEGLEAFEAQVDTWAEEVLAAGEERAS